MRLAGKVALITGAGSGMGRAAATLFAAEGAQVVVVDIQEEAGRQTVEAIRQAGGEAHFVRADVSLIVDVQRMVQTAVERYGRLDVLYNNAGIPQNPTPIEAVDPALFDRVMAVNVRGVFLGCQAAVPVMKRQGGGVILITASTIGERVRPGFSAYAPSKAAVINLTKGLALELAPYHIRVNCLNPVATDTPMLREFIGYQRSEEEGLAAFLATIPWGRFCQPEDVAQAALFLASEEAKFITGVALPVDGGRSV
ncbi:MAG: SDR family oxidoreductase [Chloroflexi bacterium]|nr:SDR family oxidoreductase [Chloroflexota bacterium]